MKSWYKDPSAALDWEFNWSRWLQTGETLTAKTVTAPAGITVDSSVLATNKVTVWLSGGTAGIDYVIACRVTTSGGRTDERSIRIQVRER